MDNRTQELVYKRHGRLRFKDPSHRSPSFPFTSQLLVTKRALWELVYACLRTKAFHAIAFKALKKLIKRFKKGADKNEVEVVRVAEEVYPSLTKAQQLELNKALDDFYETNRLDKERKLMILLCKLKFHYLAVLGRPTDESDITYLQNLLYKRDFLAHSKFHFLTIRFQGSIKRYYAGKDFENAPMSLQEYINQGIDVRFFRVYLKVLDRTGRAYDAIFLIQTLLLEFDGTDECFYYSKQCLKLCRRSGADIPNAFWRSFGLYYLKSKTLCELLIDLYKQNGASFGANLELFKDNVVEVLSSMSGTRKIWLFFEELLSDPQSGILRRIDGLAFVRFHLRLILDSLGPPRADVHAIFVLKRISRVASACGLTLDEARIAKLSAFLKAKMES